MNWPQVYMCPEKAMAPHCSILAWRIPWMEEPDRLQSMGSLRVRHDWATSFSLSCIGEGNGNPLQCSCLENPRDGEPGGLPSIGSHRVGHDWSDLTAAAAAYTCLPILNLSSHLPPYPIPLGCPRALALGALLHTLNLHDHQTGHLFYIW